MSIGHQNISNASESVIHKLNALCLAYKDSRLSHVFSLIPGAAPISSWLTGHATAIQLRRIETLLIEIESRLDNHAIELGAQWNNEALHDLIIMAVEASMKSREQGKIALLANSFSKGIKGDLSVDETAAAIEIIASLQAIDIQLLSLAVKAPQHNHIKRVFFVPDTPKTTYEGVLSIADKLPDIPLPLLLNAASHLHAKGLLKDAAMGKLAGSPHPLWAPSLLADWLVDKVLT